MFSFRSKPPVNDAAARLAALRDHLEVVQAAEAEKQRHYDAAVERSAGDTSIQTESLEVRRAHAALLQARAVTSRIRDSVAAGERILKRAQGDADEAARNAQWDEVEALTAERATAAAVVEQHTSALAHAIDAFRERNEAVHRALPHTATSHVDFDGVRNWSQLIAAELARTGITRDAIGGRPYPPRPGIAERARDLAIIVARHRTQSTDAKAAA